MAQEAFAELLILRGVSINLWCGHKYQKVYFIEFLKTYNIAYFRINKKFA